MESTEGAALRGRPSQRLCLLFLLLAATTASAQQTNRSVYTPLSEKQCRVIKPAKSGDYEGRCRATAGYTLLVTEGDLRQNVAVITPKGTKHSLDLWDVVSGGFSTVGPRAEWRMSLQNKQLVPVALIIRYNANEHPDQPNKLTSYLAVIKITATEVCVTEKISPGPNANDEARRAADVAATKPCLKSQ